MLKAICRVLLVCFIGLACYMAIWSIRYRQPVGEPASIDLRNSASDRPFSITFCSSLADNPIGFPGHTYVVWSESRLVNLKKDHSLGYMPRNFRDQIPSLIMPVPGVLLDHVTGNTRNMNMLTVIVDEAEYQRTQALAAEWDESQFEVGKRDCVAFARYIASLLNLKSSTAAIMFPQDFLCQLKQLNGKSPQYVLPPGAE